jgi:hypothetical protein
MARKCQRRQRVHGEDPDLEHLGAGPELSAGGEPGAIGDPHHAGRVLFGDVIHADQGGQFHGRADFLHALAYRRISRMLVMVDEATGKTPQTVAGLDRATAEDYASVDLDDDRRCDLRVAPQDEVVIRASLQLAAFDDPSLER